MAGEPLDVYKPCPCGSGKKIKFCCQAILGEMLKVAELQTTHQHQAALTILEAIEKKTQPRETWSRAWIKTTQAFLLFSLGQIDEPRRLVSEVLGEIPDHPLAVGISAVLALAVEGYPAAMKAVYRAFQISAGRQAHVTAFVALSLARTMLLKGHLLAAAQNFLLAIVLDPEYEEAAEAFAEFVSDIQVPYPLRDSYALAPLAGRDDLKGAFEQAAELAGKGCFSDAAKAFGAVARQEPRQPGLWWNIALCHAFAGEDPLAVEALKAAAANQPDFESAVDCLLLSRLLRPVPAESKVPRLSASYQVESVSKLLTLLDQQPEYVRFDVSGEEFEVRPAAAYHILDRDPKQVPDDELSPNTLARVRADLIIFDRIGEGQGAKAFLATYRRDRLAQVMGAFAGVAGSSVAPDGEPQEHGYLRKEHEPLVMDWYFPRSLSAARRRPLQRECFRQLVDDVWANLPQETLQGKSPREVASAPEVKMALAAAVLELDVFCEKNGVIFDQAAVRERLGLPAVQRAVPEGGAPDISLLRLRHTPLETLSDEHLVAAANHALRLGHGPLSQALILEALGRSSLKEKLDVPKLCMTLARICQRQLDPEGALNWLIRGKEEARSRKQPLDALAVWEIQELLFRSQDPADPQMAALANNLWNYYVPKLPEIRDMVVEILGQLPISGPWNAAAEGISPAAPLAAAGVTGSGLWTPETQQAGQPSKLWLPGQE